jgi:prepilin-type processing-associated H-X9-DG protein
MIRLTLQNRNRHEESSFEKKRRGFTLLELFLVIIAILILVALFLPNVRIPGPAARSSACKNNLKQIGLALHNYQDTYGTFPPTYTVDADGNPLHSWRTLILPFIEEQQLYDKIDLSKPWDDPANAEAFASFVPVYACPSAAVPENHTIYLAVVSPNSFFRPTEPRTFSESSGQSNSIAVMEVSIKDSVHWMAPQDTDEQFVLGFGIDIDYESPHTGGIQVLLVDGSVRFLSENSTADDRRDLIFVEAKKNQTAEEETATQPE